MLDIIRVCVCVCTYVRTCVRSIRTLCALVALLVLVYSHPSTCNRVKTCSLLLSVGSGQCVASECAR